MVPPWSPDEQLRIQKNAVSSCLQDMSPNRSKREIRNVVNATIEHKRIIRRAKTFQTAQQGSKDAATEQPGRCKCEVQRAVISSRNCRNRLVRRQFGTFRWEGSSKETFFMQSLVMKMISNENKKETAVMVIESIRNTVEGPVVHVIQVRCTSAKEWIREWIFHLGEESLINVVQQGGLQCFCCETRINNRNQTVSWMPLHCERQKKRSTKANGSIRKTPNGKGNYKCCVDWMLKRQARSNRFGYWKDLERMAEAPMRSPPVSKLASKRKSGQKYQDRYHAKSKPGNQSLSLRIVYILHKKSSKD